MSKGDRIAQKFDTEHNEFVVEDNVSDNLVGIASYFDEPFADPSFVPTYFVSKLARSKVTVALSGDGGDENFAGYSKYVVDQAENKIRRLLPSSVWRGIGGPAAQVFRNFSSVYSSKAASLMESMSRDPASAFFLTNAFFRQNVWDYLVDGNFHTKTGGYDPSELTRKHYSNADTDDHLQKILYTDIKTYLPGDILVKVDRMSMANSLETRAPLLDYRVVEYAAGISSGLKLKGTEKKYILKKSSEAVLPEEILYRKKMGFSVPLAAWLRGEIRSIFESMVLDKDAFVNEVFQPGRLREIWHSHLEGRQDYSQELWSVLAFELWAKRYLQA